jgi:outer membrane immunogenic protein
MRLAALAAAGLLGLTSYASAADLAAPLPVVKGPVAYSAFDWSGVYIGGHIGGGWEKTTFSDPSAAHIYTFDAFGSGAPPPAGPFQPTDIANGAAASNARPSSFLGGVQGGWMYQIGRLVVGGDFDFSWTRLNGSGLGDYGLEVPRDFVNEAYSTNTKWTGTATTMIGVARDRLLFYGTAGVAWARHDYTLASNGFSLFQAGAFAYGPASVSDTLVGWTVGTGVKWAFTNNWFLNVEYDYMDFGSKAQDFTSLCVTAGGRCVTQPLAPSFAVPATFNPTFNHQISEVKVGLNYKFAPGTFLFW